MMRKRTKAAAAAAMALAMLCGALPAVPGGAELLNTPLTAHAAGFAVLNNTDHTLYLSGEVTREQILAFRNNNKVKKIFCNSGCILPEDCSGLFQVDECWMDGPNREEYTGWQSVESIDFSHADASHVKNMKYMFACPGDIDNNSWPYYNCPKLLGLDHLNTSSVTNMYGMFEQNKADMLDLSGFDTSNVTTMEKMFMDCSALTTLNLNSFDTSKVTDMSAMFEGCWRLNTIYVSDLWSTDTVTSSNRMFCNCYSLAGGFGTKNVDEMWRKNAYYARIDGGKDAPGFLTDINSINNVRGVSLGLTDQIGVTFYVKYTDRLKKAVLAGYPGEVTVTDFTPIASGDYEGCVKLVYPVNATEARRKITLCLYNEDGARIPIYNSDLCRAPGDTIKFSVQDYLEQAPQYYPNNQKAQKLAAALGNYCNAASNYFCEKDYTVEGIEDVTIDKFEPYKQPLHGAKLSPVLNNRLELRLYTDSAVPGTIHAEQGILPDFKGTDQGYYSMSGITAAKIASQDSYEINGTTYTISPLTYGYYVMKNSDDEALKTVVRALFVYAKTAMEY